MISRVCLMLMLAATVRGQCCDECPYVETIEFTTADALSKQPFYVNLYPDAPEEPPLDNACITYFPTEGDENSAVGYISGVFTDESNAIGKCIHTGYEKGSFLNADTDVSTVTSVLGYVGCDTYLMNRCPLFLTKGPVSEEDLPAPFASWVTCNSFVMGITTSDEVKPLEDDCWVNIKKLLKDNGLCQDLYELPRSLPTQCVLKQACEIPDHTC